MYKVRLKFSKNEYSAYISHLDLMKTLQRSIIRAGLPIKYTNGFNPHIYLSILVPLSTGYQSEYDLADFELTTEQPPVDMIERLNSALPHGLHAIEYRPSLRPVHDICYCIYQINFASDYSEKATEVFKNEVKILKHSKRGDREVVLGDYINKIEFSCGENGNLVCNCTLKAGDDPLNPSYIAEVLRFQSIVTPQDRPLYIRKSVLDKDCAEFF